MWLLEGRPGAAASGPDRIDRGWRCREARQEEGVAVGRGAEERSVEGVRLLTENQRTLEWLGYVKGRC